MSVELVPLVCESLDLLFPRVVPVSDEDFPTLLPDGGELKFHGRSSAADVSFPSTVTFERAESALTEMQALARVLRRHTAGCRRAANHPARFGLVARQFPAGFVGVTGQTMAEASSEHGFYGMYVARQQGGDTSGLPAEFVGEEWGWFAPDADLGTFGTYYLVPTGSVSFDASLSLTRPRRGGEGSDIGWVLAQVGIDQAAESVRWDDEAGVRALVARVLFEDIETATTMRALSDTETVAEGLREHRYRTGLLAAREAFATAARQVRPKLVPAAAQAAAGETGVSLVRWLPTRGEGHEPGIQDLTDRRVFGWRDRKKPVNAAFVAVVAEDTSAADVRRFAENLQAKLAERDLGTVLLSSQEPREVWVVKSVASLREHYVAFRLADAGTLVELSPVAAPPQGAVPAA